MHRMGQRLLVKKKQPLWAIILFRAPAVETLSWCAQYTLQRSPNASIQNSLHYSLAVREMNMRNESHLNFCKY